MHDIYIYLSFLKVCFYLYLVYDINNMQKNPLAYVRGGSEVLNELV